MSTQNQLKLLTEKEFADTLLILLSGAISRMNRQNGIVGARAIVKANPLSDGSGRYTVSVDIGTVHKYLVDPRL